MLLAFLIFDPKLHFCKGYSLCKMADFQNRLISQIFGVFASSFLHRTTPIILYNGVSMFLAFLTFDPS